MEPGNTTSTGTIKKSGSRVAEVVPWVYEVLIIENNSGILKKKTSSNRVVLLLGWSPAGVKVHNLKRPTSQRALVFRLSCHA